MGIFKFLQKRREDELPLPPPPSPPEMPTLLRGDIEPIRPLQMERQQMTFQEEIPEPMMHEEPLPEIPAYQNRPNTAMEKEVVFDKTITEQPEQRPEKIRIIPKPTYVSVEDYKKIINDTNMIRSKLMDAENFIKKLNDIKIEEERAFEKWHGQLEDVEKKLNYVDQLIAKAGD